MPAPISTRTTLVVRSLILALILSVPSAAPVTAIQGGSTVSASSAPWLVAVLSREANGDEYSCSGSVIAARWVLTAAHCVTDGSDNSPLSPSAIRVLAPGVSPDYAGAWEQGVAPLDVYPNGLYTYYTEGFYPWADIALIELEQQLQGSSVIALDAPTAANPKRTSVRAYGWGVTNNRGTLAGSSARSVSLNVLANSGDATCREWTVQNDGQGPALICAGSNSRSAGVCSGDSGGPLVRTGQVPTQIGVTSFTGASGECATYGEPGQFVRISSMRWWIDSTIGSEEFLADTGGTEMWPYYASADYLQDVIEVGSSGNALLLGAKRDYEGWDDANAIRVYGDVARQDLSFASAYAGEEQVNFFDQYVQDASVLSDGRPIWSTTEWTGTSWIPIINVTSADGGGQTADTWDAGTGLMQKIVGSDYQSWYINGRIILPTSGGGAIAVYEIFLKDDFADIVAVEWDSSGSLTSTFGGDGWVRIGRAGIQEEPYEALVMTDGRLAILGRYQNNCAIWMVKRDGSLDTSWDRDGRRTFGSRGCIARAAEEDGAGGIFVVGADVARSLTSNSSAFITHLNQTGATDSTFGTSGYVWVRTAGVDYLIDICKTADGILVAAGQSSASSRRSYSSGVGSLGLVAIVTTAGKPTSTFGTKVYREFALGGQNDYFVSTECMSDGGVMIGGQSVLGKADDTEDLWSLMMKVNVKP